MKRLRHLLDLSAAERLLLIKALLVLIVVRLSLLILPFGPFCRRWGSLIARAGMRPPRQSLPPRRVVWLTSVASRYVPGAHCLARSFAAHLMLAQHGHRARMQIGVRKNDGRMEAHAWLEYRGVPLFESETHVEGFSLLTSINPWPENPGIAR